MRCQCFNSAVTANSKLDYWVLHKVEAKKFLNKVHVLFVRSDDECSSTSDESDPQPSSDSESCSDDDNDGMSDSDAFSCSSSGSGGIRSEDEEENVLESMKVDYPE